MFRIDGKENGSFDQKCANRAKAFFDEVKEGDIIRYQEPRDCGTVVKEMKVVEKAIYTNNTSGWGELKITAIQPYSNNKIEFELNGDEVVLEIIRTIKF